VLSGRSAAVVEIRVAGVSVFRKQGSAVTTSAATERPDSTYRIPLGP
jgi:hypothetical protein